MRATGIVRRIDDLGRVVIPKEIRRTLRIRESDPLEIFTDREGEIILKKYSPIGELGAFAKEYAEALSMTMGSLVCIADHDQIVAAAGPGAKEYLNKRINKDLENFIAERNSTCTSSGNFIKVVEDDSQSYTAQTIYTITSAGDAIGAVLLLCRDGSVKMDETEKKVAAVAAGFLGRQMEQ